MAARFSSIFHKISLFSSIFFYFIQFVVTHKVQGRLLPSRAILQGVDMGRSFSVYLFCLAMDPVFHYLNRIPGVISVQVFFFLIAGCIGSLGYWQSLAKRESKKQHQWYCIPKESQVPIHYDLRHHNLCMTERMVH